MLSHEMRPQFAANQAYNRGALEASIKKIPREDKRRNRYLQALDQMDGGGVLSEVSRVASAMQREDSTVAVSLGYLRPDRIPDGIKMAVPGVQTMPMLEIAAGAEIMVTNPNYVETIIDADIQNKPDMDEGKRIVTSKRDVVHHSPPIWKSRRVLVGPDRSVFYWPEPENGIGGIGENESDRKPSQMTRYKSAEGEDKSLEARIANALAKSIPRGEVRSGITRDELQGNPSIDLESIVVPI